MRTPQPLRDAAQVVAADGALRSLRGNWGRSGLDPAWLDVAVIVIRAQRADGECQRNHESQTTTFDAPTRRSFFCNERAEPLEQRGQIGLRLA
jgi:hypothetical protein